MFALLRTVTDAIIGPRPFHIEVGGHYTNRMGDKVHIIRQLDFNHPHYLLGYEFMDTTGRTYFVDGSFSRNSEHRFDLVSEIDQ